MFSWPGNPAVTIRGNDVAEVTTQASDLPLESVSGMVLAVFSSEWDYSVL